MQQLCWLKRVYPQGGAPRKVLMRTAPKVPWPTAPIRRSVSSPRDLNLSESRAALRYRVCSSSCAGHHLSGMSMTKCGKRRARIEAGVASDPSQASTRSAHTKGFSPIFPPTISAVSRARRSGLERSISIPSSRNRSPASSAWSRPISESWGSDAAAGPCLCDWPCLIR